MICTNCNKNVASTRVIRTVNGVSREYFLCKFCADSLNFSANIMNFLPGNFFKSTVKDIQRTPAALRTTCSFCKSTFEEVSARGVVGCAECYSTFKAQLAPYLNRIHSKVLHVGKVPNSASGQILQKRALSELRIQLNSAIETQNFEQAAILRDEMKSMEKNEGEGST